ncbi:MAG: hypothetical protein IPP71_09855 [Bacteroidetes bacterium]|nr:hypothetical protein [Bacteroidota bacterium]
MESNTYLIIGRRGSGKTSLSQYFTFQKDKSLKGSICIDVDEPNLYQHILKKISRMASGNKEIALPRIVKIWEYLIWALIFEEFKEHDEKIQLASYFSYDKVKPSVVILQLLQKLISRFTKDEHSELADDFETLLTSKIVQEAQERVRKLTSTNPVIVAIDTLEHYDVNDESMMQATAALVECASKFNTKYLKDNIHLKVFVSAEVFPHLIENVISNPSKYIRNPVYLNWRPKDLIRLLCWRFYLYLKSSDLNNLQLDDDIDWNQFKDVYNKMWVPYFKENVENCIGIQEKTFPYVLRHTQMRPRQLIILCNEIGEEAMRLGSFPLFTNEVIVNSVTKIESILANEVINSYKSVYENVSKIVDALVSKPIMFKGKLLDKIAPETASAWPPNTYSPLKFRQLVAELGIVGRVREYKEDSGIVLADFEYTMHDRLPLQPNDDCVIHPMFFRRLNTKNTNRLRVYPFPDSDSYKEMTIT